MNDKLEVQLNRIFTQKFSCLFIFFILLGLFTGGCVEQSQSGTLNPNPAAIGFNIKNSDSTAIAIADKVMESNGGRAAWDNTQYLSWVFFGNRKHYWNKFTGDAIIESKRDNYRIKMNIHDSTKIELVLNNQSVTQPDSLSKYWKMGKGAWINDSYWLVMPYKLKDSGVSLNYMGMDTTLSGDISHKLKLRFEEVGNTPENTYYVYVDTSSSRVVQWDFYRTAQDSVPRFQLPWTNYVKYDQIWLSSDRGDRLKLTEISANDSLAVYFK